MPMVTVVSSTNTGFTFQIVSVANGAVQAITGPLSVDFITVAQSL